MKQGLLTHSPRMYDCVSIAWRKVLSIRLNPPHLQFRICASPWPLRGHVRNRNKLQTRLRRPTSYGYQHGSHYCRSLQDSLDLKIGANPTGFNRIWRFYTLYSKIMVTKAMLSPIHLEIENGHSRQPAIEMNLKTEGRIHQWQIWWVKNRACTAGCQERTYIFSDFAVTCTTWKICKHNRME